MLTERQHDGMKLDLTTRTQQECFYRLKNCTASSQCSRGNRCSSALKSTVCPEVQK